MLDPTYWLTLTLVLGVSLVMASRDKGASRFLMGLAAKLSMAFLIGFRALDYRFMVGALSVLAVAVTLVPRPRPDQVSGEEVRTVGARREGGTGSPDAVG